MRFFDTIKRQLPLKLVRIHLRNRLLTDNLALLPFMNVNVDLV